MKNDELFTPRPDTHSGQLILAYGLRGLLDERGAYRPQDLLACQYAVYEKWLAEAQRYLPGTSCDFYEWLHRDCDSAFIFKPGDLVKYDGRYCVVTRWNPDGISRANCWCIRNGAPTQETLPMPMTMIGLKDSNGHTRIADALSKSLEPADIPPEIFALACGKAKDCPMMKGGVG